MQSGPPAPMHIASFSAVLASRSTWAAMPLGGAKTSSKEEYEDWLDLLFAFMVLERALLTFADAFWMYINGVVENGGWCVRLPVPSPISGTYLAEALQWDKPLGSELFISASELFCSASELFCSASELFISASELFISASDSQSFQVKLNSWPEDG